MTIGVSSFEFVWSRVLRNSGQKWKFNPLPSIIQKANHCTPTGGTKSKSMSGFMSGFMAAGLGLVIFIGSHSAVSDRDMPDLAQQALMAGEESWSADFAAGGELVTASLVNLLPDRIITGALQATQTVIGFGDLRPDNPDNPYKFEQAAILQPPVVERPTINRDLKGDRVVTFAQIGNANNFSAGSVPRHQGLLSPLDADKKQSLAFVKPKPSSEAFKIAAAFHFFGEAEKRALAKLPTLVASLVRVFLLHQKNEMPRRF